MVGPIRTAAGYMDRISRGEIPPPIAETYPGDFDALVIPGGRAPEYLRLDRRVIEAVQHFDRARKPIAAICHGPQLLAAAGALRGRTCIAYPAVGPECTLAGARFGEVDAGASNALTDGNLVTAPAWPAHPEWMRQFLKLLGSRIEA